MRQVLRRNLGRGNLNKKENQGNERTSCFQIEGVEHLRDCSSQLKAGCNARVKVSESAGCRTSPAHGNSAVGSSSAAKPYNPSARPCLLRDKSSLARSRLDRNSR